MAEVITLNISDDFSAKIKEADSEIKKLVATSEDARNKIIQHFKDMGNLGVDEFIRKVHLAQEALKKLTTGEIKGTVFGGFAGEAGKAADAANKLIEALLKISTANLERIAKNKELQEMHAILNARRKEAAEYKDQQAQIKRLDNEAKQRKRELVQQDRDNANQAKITSEQRKVSTEKEVQALKREQDQLKMNGVTFKNYTKAMMMSEMTNNSRIKKIERLNTVLRDMQREEHKYSEEIANTKQKIKDLERENRRVTESVKKIRNSKRRLMDTVGQLQRSLALLFSVSKLIGYFNKMVEIRKEMELQQKSLQVLLQNKDEADKLWDKVIDLAVKSPFRVKELVKYTKQLAAYRIESDQLFDTTKRLSDVSAGLGVDMQRLILAYGQIRAAGFLRGTELRQLTEAGIPMLDELAKYLTEVEGRAIRTGDVFGMISKRMISFEDVAQVFKRMTSEGGVFFNMQEEQSKTLAGQISNLHDSIDLMLNDIGKYYDSDLKGSVQSLREFVAGWRDVSTQIKATLVLWSPFIAYSTLARLSNSRFATSLYEIVTLSPKVARGLRSINTNLDWWGRKSKAASIAANMLKTTLAGLSTLGVGLALAGITYGLSKLWVELTRSSRESKELKRNLTNIVNEDTSNLNRQIEGYKNLATRLEKANQGSKDRREAISKLNSEYGEYMDFVVDEKTTMEQLAAAYEDVVKRMKEKASLATMEKGLQAISNSYGESLEDATDSFYNMLKGASIKKKGDDWGLSSITPTKKEIDDIFNLVQTRIREANVESIDDLNEQQELIQDIIKGYYGEEFFLSRDYAQGIELIEIMIEKKEKEAELQKQINREYKETLKSREANLAFEKLQNSYIEKQNKIKNTAGLTDFEVKKQLNEAAQKFELDKIELKLEFGEISEVEAARAKDRIINWADDTIKAVNDKIRSELSKSYTEAEYSQILITQEEYGKGLSAIIENTTQGWEIANQIIAEQISLKSEGLPIDEAVLKNAEKQAELYKKRAEYLGIELDYVKKIDKASVDSINSQLGEKYQISLEDSYKSVMQLQEQANKKRQEAIALEEALNLQRERGVAINEEELAQIKADVEGWTKLWKLLGGQEKEKGSGGSSKNSLYDERIKVIDDMNKKYKELNKTLGQTDALQGAFEAYIDAFAEAYKGISWVPSNVKEMTPQEFASKVLNFPNENDLVSFLDKLANEPMKAFEKIKVELAKGEFVYDIKVRTKEENDKELLEQIEDMFSGYELSLELQKLNIPPDLAKQLFNVDSIDLSSIRSKIEYDLAKARGLGGQEDLIKELEKQLEKVEDIENKAQQERLKKYTTYLLKAQSERVKIKLDEIRQLAEIEKLGFSETQKEQIKQTIQLETKQKLDKAGWDAFKETDLYVQMFEDLGVVSEKVLNDLKTRLTDIRGSLSDLSPRELKEVVSQLEKVTSEQISRNPFKNLGSTIKDGVKALKRLKKEQEEYANALKKQESIQKRVDNLQIINKQAESQIEAAKAILLSNDATEQQRTEAQHIITENEQIIKQNNILLELEIKKLAAQKGITDEAARRLIITRQEANEATKTLNSVGNYGTQAVNSIQQMTDMLENWGVEFGEEVDETLNGLGQMFSALESIDLTKPMSIITGTISFIAGVGNTLASLFGFGNKDKKKERQIQREIKYVEDLERAYKKLEKQIDAAYTLDTLKGSYDAAQKNIDEQIASYNKMIAAEEDKKKTDKDRIKEWQQTIEDLSEQRKELLKSQVEELGGGYDYSAMTEEFVNAWLEAFKETGDGLSGLADNFEDFWQNIAIKQAVMGGASKIMQPFLDAVNKALENDFKLDDSEMANIDQLSAKAKEDMNAFLEQWYDRWGDFMTQGEQSELSGLQRGISGITEQQADILAAYANSCRFFLANIDTTLSSIANQILGGENMPNPMLSELRAQTEIVRAIRDMFSSVIKSGHPTYGGAFIKVAL